MDNRQSNGQPKTMIPSAYYCWQWHKRLDTLHGNNTIPTTM